MKPAIIMVCNVHVLYPYSDYRPTMILYMFSIVYQLKVKRYAAIYGSFGLLCQGWCSFGTLLLMFIDPSSLRSEIIRKVDKNIYGNNMCWHHN